MWFSLLVFNLNIVLTAADNAFLLMVNYFLFLCQYFYLCFQVVTPPTSIQISTSSWFCLCFCLGFVVTQSFWETSGWSSCVTLVFEVLALNSATQLREEHMQVLLSLTPECKWATNTSHKKKKSLNSDSSHLFHFHSIECIKVSFNEVIPKPVKKQVWLYTYSIFMNLVNHD